MPLRHLYHVRSNVATAQGLAKLPDVQDIGYGEIAINYAQGLETISLKNSNNAIVPFTPNTNSYVANVNAAITENSLESIVTPVNVSRYQDFNISYLVGNTDVAFDLSDFIEYIVTTFYTSPSLHVVLHVAKDDDDYGNNTNFIVNADSMALLMGDANTPLSTASRIIGFTNYGTYFVAGDSPAMNGIEIDWDSVTKAISVRFMYSTVVYGLGGTPNYVCSVISVPNVTVMDRSVNVRQIMCTDQISVNIKLYSGGDPFGQTMTYELRNANNQSIANGTIQGGKGTIDMAQYQPGEHTLWITDGKGAQKVIRIVRKS